MNKFKYLQVVGTITVLSPVILVVIATLIFWASLASKPEVVVEEVAEVKLPDTVVVTQEVKPSPVVVKPAPVVKPTPVPVVKDTVKAVVESLDTTK